MLELITCKQRKETQISNMFNTELGAVLAVIRRPSDSNVTSLVQDNADTALLLFSLKSLRPIVFDSQIDWHSIDPVIYLSPFLDVIQHDDVPAAATGAALSSVKRILDHRIFDETTPGAREAVNSLVLTGIPSCRLEKTDPATEDAIMMKILLVLESIMKHPASVHLIDNAVCTLINACFQIMQRTSTRGDLLQRIAKNTMLEIIRVIFSKLPDVNADDIENAKNDETGYGITCLVDIFQFLCSLLNASESNDNDGFYYKEDLHLFALEMINSIIELGGDSINNHPKLLKILLDDLFYNLICYGARCRPLTLAIISNIALNVYKFLRKYIRLQLEAFFEYVLIKVASAGSSIQLQEVALESIVNFCRQPCFIVEAYVNYDCEPTCINVFESIGKLLCKLSYYGATPLHSLQAQAYEGMEILAHAIASNIDKEDDPTASGPYPVEITEYRPFWVEKQREDHEAWVEHIRFRKQQKKAIFVAGNHYNRDEKKGLEYLRIRQLVSDPPEAKAVAVFFRFTPGLDKTFIGEYLGDPDEFHLEVLKEFTNTFEFSGMVLDTAFRTYLASFRLPGESQKIHRIMEAFSDKYYEYSDVFVTKDALLVLCYSLIMLNTDQHNPQVRKKMTEEEFIKNNRQINGGKDLPREYLSELFHSIASNGITVFGQSVKSVEMNPSKWIELVNRSESMLPFVACEFDRRLGRDMLASIAGPVVASLSASFEHAEDDDVLHACIEGLISLARITQYGLEDILDELVAMFSKYTTLTNSYSTPDEILFGFSNDTKPKLATLAVFTIANSYGSSIRDGWGSIVECVIKLKKLKLLPNSAYEMSGETSSFDSSNFVPMESREDMVALGMSEIEQNMKVIKQCRVGNIFTNSSRLCEEALLSLARSLVFAAGGKGQKFSTPMEEDETVTFCWDLIVITTSANIHRFQGLWPTIHESLITVLQSPLFSPEPFAEKAIVRLFEISIKLLSSPNTLKSSEEFIFKSINLMWKIDKEILDMCYDVIIGYVIKILLECSSNIKTPIGWKLTLQLLSITGRHPETYDRGVETLITLMSMGTRLSAINYIYCIDCAFGFVALRNSPLENNLKILDLLAGSAELLVKWYRESGDAGFNFSGVSNMSTSSSEESNRGPNMAITFLLKLGEAFRKTSLARREDIRNHAIVALKRSFMMIQDLDFSYANCFNCFNLIMFAMVDDLHEKMVEYSRRENAEKEMRSMEGTLKLAIESLTDLFLVCLKPLASNLGFRTFWLGVLRRMDTCMKADLGVYGQTKLQEVVPDLLKKMIIKMKDEDILVPTENDDLWEITYIQIQWIAPSLKGVLFPEFDL